MPKKADEREMKRMISEDREVCVEKKPGFEPGTRHLVRVPLYPIELLGRCKSTYYF